MELAGVRVTLLPTGSSRSGKAPSAPESAAFLDLAEQVLDRFRPQIMLTYGGDRIGRELIARAHRRGIVVVFQPSELPLFRSRAVRAGRRDRGDERVRQESLPASAGPGLQGDP